MASHINKDGKFQSDKYPSCPPGKVPLSVTDPMAQDLLWMYAQRRREVDAQFASDLETCLQCSGYGLQFPSLIQRMVLVLFGDGLGEGAQQLAERLITRAVTGVF